MPRAKTLYSVLGVPPGSYETDIKAAYYELAKKHHPDTFGGFGADADCDKFIEIGNAYAVLSDKASRKAYDRRLLIQGHQCKSCKGIGLIERTRKSFTSPIVYTSCFMCDGTGQEDR